MVDRKAFMVGMRALAVLPGRELTEALVSVYHDILAARFDDASWLAAVKRALETETFFPAPAFFFALSRAEEEAAVHVEAAAAFDAVTRCTSYNPNTGTRVQERAVRERCGIVTFQAFVAAGGAAAFNAEDERALTFVRKEFCDVYLKLARARDERLSLPAPDPRKALEAGESQGIVRQLSRASGGRRELPEVRERECVSCDR